MKNNKKTIALSKETLGHLTAGQLAGVEGGAPATATVTLRKCSQAPGECGSNVASCHCAE
jgi:hypothetical protein